MSTAAKSISSDQLVTRAGLKTRVNVMLAVMLLSVFMTVANIFIVNVATPSLQRGLHSSFSGVQFVITGYTLAYAVALIIGGRLGDRFGRKRMLAYGVAGFTITSLLSGFSSGVNMLILFRIMQGLSAAMIAPQVLALIQINYVPEKRGAVFGLYGAAQGLAASTGQIIGGLLLHWNPLGLEWRTVFFFSVPFGIIILGMLPFISESKSAVKAKLDWIGALSVAIGLLMMIFPLVQGQKEGWPLWLDGCLILSLPVLAVFVWYERRIARSGGIPFMNVDLFKQKVFTAGMLIVFLLLCSQAAFFLVAAYFLQMGIGFTALQAGLVILPMGMGYFLASLFSSKAVAKYGAHVLTFGAVLSIIGFLSLALTVHATGVAFQRYESIPALLILGIGQGAIAAPLTNTVLAKIRSSDIGSASGILTTGMQVAFALGIALIGVIFLNTMRYHADTVSGEVSQQLRQQLSAISHADAQNEMAVQQFRSCYADFVRTNDPSVLSASCKINSERPEIQSVFKASIKSANAQNYTDAFQLCLYVLAVISAGLLLLVLALAKGNRSTEPNGETG
ncbi:MFS transporter [Brevibacillus choshinensis]|uniref:MFS transporter n=1 Tax=Brevibacillus choshinensis TaxID=54911 RepID=UPI0006EC04B3|nr:MFS transporter [Brevibacillus choshinensis]